MGAPYPATVALNAPATQPHAMSLEEGRKFWSFQPPSPCTQGEGRGEGSSIDNFVLAKLKEKNLSPSSPAPRRTLLRRATFDLLGLPPTAKEVEAFESDQSPNAFEKVIDRLLASPHYGERWARYWLDIARYADTKGYVFFEEAAFTWGYTYRDYVIRAFNDDLPYDRFLLEQLAADQLPLKGDQRPLTGLGF